MATAPLLALGALAGACATGDGKTLRPPAPGATAPPPETEPPDDVEDAAVVDPGATLPPVPITTAPTSLGGTVTVAVPADADVAQFAAFAPWATGSAIEEAYTCFGLNASPPVSWTGLPDGTREVAITMVDETTVQRGRPFARVRVQRHQSPVGGFVQGVEGQPAPGVGDGGREPLLGAQAPHQALQGVGQLVA